jgi:uncharacterized membrane protein YgcG
LGPDDPSTPPDNKCPVLAAASRAVGQPIEDAVGLFNVASHLVALFLDASRRTNVTTICAMVRLTQFIVGKLLHGTRTGAEVTEAQDGEAQCTEAQDGEAQCTEAQDGEAQCTEAEGDGDAGGEHDDDDSDANEEELIVSGSGWFVTPLLAVMRNDPGALRVALARAAPGGAPSHVERAAVLLTLRWIVTLHPDLAASVDAAENDMRRSTLAAAMYLTPWLTGGMFGRDADASGGGGGGGHEEAASPGSSSSAGGGSGGGPASRDVP